MKLLLDTHFLIWTTLEHRRLRSFPWLKRYQPWGISPVSLLELQFLSEVGRLSIELPAFLSSLGNDQRFVTDDPHLLSVIKQACGVTWTRDPFDRLLVAHSALRRLPLCTVDRAITAHYPLLPKELTKAD